MEDIERLEWFRDKHRKALRHAQYCGDQWEYYEDRAGQLAVIANALASECEELKARSARAEAKLQELIGFTAELLSYYNATPDEWDHFKVIIGRSLADGRLEALKTVDGDN